MSHSQPTEIIRQSQTAPEIQDLALEEVIGQGGMSTVYRGYQQVLDRPVAVKFLDAAVVGGAPAALERFRQEARLLASLQHPSIVACYTAGVAAGRGPYLVLELVEGPDLARYLRENGAVKPLTALRVLRAIASGLQYAQQTASMIHRDIKPENVLLKPSTVDGADADFPYVAKLTDLGIAKANVAGTPDLNLTGAGNLIGTPMAMAPEQFTSPNDLDHRTDIYGLGYVLYWMLTGRSPFTQKTVRDLMQAKGLEAPPDPRAVAPDLPPGVAELCIRMMAIRPADRFSTYADLIAMLDALIGDPKSTAQIPTGRAAAQGKGAAIAAFAVVAALALVAGWYAVQAVRKPAPQAPIAPTPVAIAVAAAPVAPVATPAPSPAPSPIVAAVAAPATTPVGEPSWNEDGESLFGSTADQRLEGWMISPQSSSILADKNSDGVSLTGPSEMTRALPDGPWMVGGVLEPRDARKAQIFARFEDGTRYGIRAEVLGPNTLVRWTDGDAAVGDPISLTGTTQLSVRFIRVAEQLRIEVGNEVRSFTRKGAASMGLSVGSGVGNYHDFVLMVPAGQ